MALSNIEQAPKNKIGTTAINEAIQNLFVFLFGHRLNTSLHLLALRKDYDIDDTANVSQFGSALCCSLAIDMIIPLGYFHNTYFIFFSYPIVMVDSGYRYENLDELFGRRLAVTRPPSRSFSSQVHSTSSNRTGGITPASLPRSIGHVFPRNRLVRRGMTT